MFMLRHLLMGVLLPWLSVTPVYLVAQAPTDEELKALEQKIEQQEAKQKAEAEAKKRTEAEAKRKTAEERRKREEEAAKQAEEAKKKEEQDKRDKYSALIAEAEKAVRDKDQEVAVAKYKEALALYPDEAAPKAGLAEAEKLPDKLCRDFPGEWESSAVYTMTFNPDGTMQGLNVFVPFSGTWICDSKTHVIEIKTGLGDTNAVLKEDGCLVVVGSCYRKKSGNDGKTQDKR